MATIYKVWGWDTFSSEEYSCGEFYSYDEAVAKCKEMEERVAQFQSPDLRDKFSIQTATEEELREQERQKDEFLHNQLAEQIFSTQTLRHHIAELLQQLAQKMEMFDALNITEEYANLIIVSKDKLAPANCFNEIQLVLMSLKKEDTQLAVDLKIFFPTTEYNTGGNISGFLWVGTFEQIQTYLKEEDTVKIVSERATKLVDKFYD